MVEHIAGHPELRDRAIFVGNPDDIVDEPLGPELPMIRDWTERHFDFAGYVTGFDPRSLGDRDELRHELGYRAGEKVCIVTVGGSGVGADLLRRVIASFRKRKRWVPELRMIVVAGPRIDAAALPQADGLEVAADVHNLYRHLAACDLAVVQGAGSSCRRSADCYVPCPCRARYALVEFFWLSAPCSRWRRRPRPRRRVCSARPTSSGRST